jgi:hypothetical protein
MVLDSQSSNSKPELCATSIGWLNSDIKANRRNFNDAIVLGPDNPYYLSALRILRESEIKLATVAKCVGMTVEGLIAWSDKSLEETNG